MLCLKSIPRLAKGEAKVSQEKLLPPNLLFDAAISGCRELTASPPLGQENRDEIICLTRGFVSHPPN